MQEVVRQLSEKLSAMGHEVTVATSRHRERTEKLCGGVRIEEFDVRGNLAQGMTGEVERYRDYVINSGFDVIANFAAQQWATDAIITMLDAVRAKKVFVPTGFSGLYSVEFRDYFEAMGTWMKHYDMNVFLSNDYRDINFARENGVANIVVIPNGASEKEFLGQDVTDIRRKLKIPDKDFLILHVGSHTRVKGHSEAIEIFRRAGISHATFLLVGNDVGGCTRSCLKKAARMNNSREFRDACKRIIVTPLARVETIAALKAADLFLFPSNIECSPIVLFECMASKTPFLVTDVGNSSEIIEWSGAGELLPTTRVMPARDFLGRLKNRAGGLLHRSGLFDDYLDCGYMLSIAEMEGSCRILAALHRDGRRRERMAADGFSAWQERFTWEKIAGSYEKLYRGLLTGSPPGVCS